jgi:hypothetical protein
MTSIVTDFKSIRQKLERQEQKAEYEANNPVPDMGTGAWPYGAVVPLTTSQIPSHTHTLTTAELPSHMHAVTMPDGSWRYLYPTTKI